MWLCTLKEPLRALRQGLHKGPGDFASIVGHTVADINPALPYGSYTMGIMVYS